MSTTTVPAAKAWLYANLPAQVNDSTVEIAYDRPAGNADDLLVVGGSPDLFGQTVSDSTTWVVLGGGVLQEDYTIVVTVDVFRGGDDFKTTFERCASLVDSVVTLVRSDITLGGAVMLSRPESAAYAPSWDEDHKGTRCVATVQVACTARI